MSRKIDMLISHHVMNWKMSTVKSIDGYSSDQEQIVPHYSTSITAAWKVVEKMLSDDFLLFLSYAGEFGLPVGWTFDSKEYESDETIPMAICLAALKIKGIIVDELDSNLTN